MLESGFRRRILEKAFEKQSRVVLAFDEHNGEEAVNRLSTLCESLREHVVGIKIGLPTMLSTGLKSLSRLVKRFNEDYVFISDVKMADVSHVNSLTSRLLYEAGFDAVISHGFIGYEGGLDGLFNEAKRFSKGVIIVVSMSHTGSIDFIDPVADMLVQTALKHGADGVVAPATRLRIVEEARKKAGSSLLILTPGVGAQGAPYGAGLSAGADFEIIGRSITGSLN
ncbi:MAG: orotidine-5'-phosphate decarboxylase, partial [Crenarchaeota archaeon]|nr:orotidine-5'-phosphate decarboxylase [Thermoproteota archaeon]